jgi:hypothetical protein
MKGGIFRRPFFIKLFNWEYWSFAMVYSWIYPVWFFLSLRARSPFFFSAANPSIKNGGFLGESKKDIHAIMPPDIYPPTIHFNVGESPEKVLRTLAENKFEYPLVGKPDMGGRGRGVKVLKNEKDVLNYINLCTVDFHIQQFINLPNEAGIFYYRLPGEANGRITGIVGKEFLSVEGDGISTIRNLLMKSDRALLQVKSLENIYGAYLDTVLPRNEKQVLVPYGNHARGAKFIDNTSVADKHLEEVIDSVCKRVKDFYFGRLDIRYNTWEELKQGKNFWVIEVNGAGSEPTHIYDPSHNLFFAWKEIIRHWHILWKISRLNHKKGHRYLSIKEGMEMFREDKENSKKIEAMPE